MESDENHKDGEKKLKWELRGMQIVFPLIKSQKEEVAYILRHKIRVFGNTK